MLLVKDLVDFVGLVSYDAGVTNADLWRAVGTELRDTRLRQGYRSTKELADKVGRPDQKTMDRIERGEPGLVVAIGAYCDALKISLVTVLRAVLANGQLSADAWRVAAGFDALRQTPLLQRMMLDLARHGHDLLNREADTTPYPASPAAHTPSSHGTAGDHGRKRRAKA